MRHQPMVDAHGACDLAPATRRATVVLLGHLIEVLVGECKATKEPGFGNTRVGEIAPVHPQQELRAMAGDVPRIPRCLVELARRGAATSRAFDST